MYQLMCGAPHKGFLIDGKKEIKRVAVLTFTIFPWNIPLFNRLNQHENVTFHFFFGSIRTKRRVWKINEKKLNFSYSLLRTTAINSKTEKFVSIDILRQLWRFDPDVIICYGFGLTNLQSLIYAILKNKKIVIWGEMPLQIEKERSLLLRFYRKLFARICTAGLASSSQTIDFFKSIKVRKVFRALLTVDKVNIEVVPKDKYIDGKKRFVLLYVGSIEYRKGVDLLLKTFEQVQPLVHKEITMRIVGNTNIDPNYINELGIYRNNPAIEFINFTDDVAKHYLEADLFLLFTRRDAHAMVVPEAMSYGLPIICSKYAGCVDDFVKENGYIVDPYNIKENATLIGQLIMNPSRLHYMANYSLRILRENSNKQSAEEILKMIYVI